MSDFEEAFGDLYRCGYRIAYRLLGDRLDAEDVAQEATARAYVRWGKIASYGEPWVARVSSNLALGMLRRRPASPDVPPTTGAPEDDTLARTYLVPMLAQLPKRQREVLVLRYVADLSIREVARVLDCSEGSVKRHAHRALETLRRRVGVAPEWI